MPDTLKYTNKNAFLTEINVTGDKYHVSDTQIEMLSRFLLPSNA